MQDFHTDIGVGAKDAVCNICQERMTYETKWSRAEIWSRIDAFAKKHSRCVGQEAK